MKRIKIGVVAIVLLAFTSMSSQVSAKSAVDATRPLKTAKGDIIEPVEMAPAKAFRALAAPTVDPRDWFNNSPELDGLEGSSVNRVYDTFRIKRKGRPVVVAVIDSGVDIYHEDLQGKIWVNRDEIPDNGIDDDENGFVDDIHGWNFIGGRDGRNVNWDTWEVTREYVRYQELLASGEPLTPEQIEYFTRVENDYNAGLAQAQAYYAETSYYYENANTHKAFLTAELGITDFSREALLQIQSTDPAVNEAVAFLLETLDYWGSYEQLERYYTYDYDDIHYHFNTEYNGRNEIVQDNPDDLTETGYGNNDVTASFSSHGTHVAGIIAADRFNGIGVNGVASNVKIMVVRTIPDGDERDKDVANAVKYAVDNGADIINMSFGKAYSPHKGVVDDAFIYAALHNVLIVHAAGNDRADNDVVDNFPNRRLKAFPGVDIPTWIEVGASAYTKGPELVAYFSNYGLNSVELFAPGYRVVSTVRNNEYASYSGTSMACPVVAGVAALVKSQFRGMHAMGIKHLLMDTVRTYPELDVQLPGNPDQLVPFMDLSMTGGVVDAFSAFSQLKSDRDRYEDADDDLEDFEELVEDD